MRPLPLLFAAIAFVFVLTSCARENEPSPDPSPSTPTQTSDSPATEPSPQDTGSNPSEYTGTPRVAGAVASELEVPWGLAFLPDGSAIVTERDSTRVLRLTAGGNGRGDITELGTIEMAAPAVEGGLLGVAVSPEFDSDRAIYLYATAETDNRVLRVELDGDTLGEPEVLLDSIPKGPIHDGGRLAFGPDGMLYVSTGETGERDLAQDPESLAGKILRLTPDGDPAPGNPDPDSYVWSLGHRNVQGLAFDDEERLWASEFGDSTYDELNLIEKGGNYGWPEVEGVGDREEFIDPVLTWSTDQASPSGLAYADGALWMAGLRGETLWQIPLDKAKAGEPTARFQGEYGRLRTVVPAPDGTLWLATSNHDGRGLPAAEDDRILRVRLTE